MAGGLYHTLALKTDGSLWTWGYNGYGQLCRGDEYWQPGFQAPGMDNEVYALAPPLFIQSPGMMFPDYSRTSVVASPAKSLNEFNAT